MRAGPLDRRIRIERKTVAQDASGQEIETWNPISTRFASVGPVRDSERFLADQFLARAQTQFEVRYGTDILDLNPLDRIIYPPVAAPDPHQIYDVLGVREIGRREGLRIIAQVRPEIGPLTGEELDPDAQAIIDEMTVTPDEARQMLISDLVAALKAAGVWTKFDVLFVFAAHTQQAALLNWKNPSVVPASNINATPFTVDQGFTGDGTNYINSNFNAATFGGGYALNDAHIAVRVNTNIAASMVDVGGRSAVGVAVSLINPRSATDVVIWGINQGGSVTIGNADSTGYWLANRTGPGAIGLYRNGAALDFNSNASDAVFNGNFFIGALNENGSPVDLSTRQIGLAHMGSQLATQEIANADAAFDAYFAGLTP